jgi:hypothetical protein
MPWADAAEGGAGRSPTSSVAIASAVGGAAAAALAVWWLGGWAAARRLCCAARYAPVAVQRGDAGKRDATYGATNGTIFLEPGPFAEQELNQPLQHESR